jgi:glycosyltransferase involved in cell wall biosynthesis
VEPPIGAPRPLRICCVATQVADHVIGGMAQQTTQLAIDLARLGHEVTILTTARADGVECREQERVAVHYLAGTVPGAQTAAWWTASTAAFRRLQRARGFDVVWSQSVAAAAIARSLGARDPALVAIIQGTSPQMIASIVSSVRHARTRPPLVRSLRRLARQLVNYAVVDPAIYRRAALVMPVSRTVAAAVRRWHRVAPERVVVVPNAVDAEHFTPDPARRAAVRARFGLEDAALVLLTVGILGEQKGVDLAIEALARLGRRDARLLVVGDGPARPALEALARARGVADDVRFAGAVAYDAVAGFYDAADVFLFPTLRREGLPGVVVEAMAAERPVVASRIGATEELVEDARTGFLVPLGDVDGLVARIRALAADPALARAMGRRARVRVLERWTPEVRSRRVTELLAAIRPR